VRGIHLGKRLWTHSSSFAHRPRLTIIARDDLMRQAEEDRPFGALRRDVFNITRIDMSQPTRPEERSDLTVVEDPGARWTRLSLAEICGGGGIGQSGL
jgi:hypothetical protein